MHTTLNGLGQGQLTRFSKTLTGLRVLQLRPTTVCEPEEAEIPETKVEEEPAPDSPQPAAEVAPSASTARVILPQRPRRNFPKLRVMLLSALVAFLGGIAVHNYRDERIPGPTVGGALHISPVVAVAAALVSRVDAAPRLTEKVQAVQLPPTITRRKKIIEDVVGTMGAHSYEECKQIWPEEEPPDLRKRRICRKIVREMVATSLEHNPTRECKSFLNGVHPRDSYRACVKIKEQD